MKPIDIAEAFAMYKDELSLRKNKDYIVNQEQMEKFKRAYNFFVQLVDECHGNITETDWEPKKEHCSMSCELPLLYIHGGSAIKEFAEVIGGMAAISIDAKLDGTVCISFTVPNVFQHK